jgi:hypothetical protein
MSTDWYLCCHDCKKIIHIAQDGFSGFGYYSGEPDCQKKLFSFFADHVFLHGHKLEFVMEQTDPYDNYEHIEWLGKNLLKPEETE